MKTRLLEAADGDTGGETYFELGGAKHRNLVMVARDAGPARPADGG